MEQYISTEAVSHQMGLPEIKSSTKSYKLYYQLFYNQKTQNQSIAVSKILKC